MEKRSRFVGLDVHAETIAVAVAEPDGEVRSLGIIPNRLESVRKLFKKLGPSERLRVCYEAGPTGYRLYWQLAAIGQLRSGQPLTAFVQANRSRSQWSRPGCFGRLSSRRPSGLPEASRTTRRNPCTRTIAWPKDSPAH